MREEASEAAGIVADHPDYDAAIVGASLAGCATAIFLGRAGARVALIERQPDVGAFKRICSHFIQASAVPTLERLDLLDPILAAGGIRSQMRAWTPWGWIEAPAARAGYAVNLRRELLDPLLREAAASTPGVDLILGCVARDLIREGGAVRGVSLHDLAGTSSELRARLVVGADGRGSAIADLAGVRTKTLPHERFAYGGYFEGASPAGFPNSSVWMLDPHWAAAFPTDAGLTFYAAMPTKERLPEFKADPEAALVSFVAAVPDPPPIRAGQLVGPVLGKIEMPNSVRVPTAPGLALVGDAALTADPLFGVGCGWALQSGEWLAASVAPALRGEESLDRGLARYRRRHRKELRGHALLVNGYSSGRRLDPGERTLFAAAARDPKVAAAFDALGTRRTKPGRVLATAVPRAIVVNARHAIGRRRPSNDRPGLPMKGR
ncbi:MAG TPA: NAD(P)/FAD-dependent oxidoreductase [Solirubrobacterales bacterium]|jgi:2-polyprenyl-6-methoxyphenol hydroxylase-like FAD-dependent oxidoreductase|nr:NAD(P)/FAD-dependent oxidoreductase [Solirubrobacterales bacterium]